ncbi:MAG TPA: choice-of-anchor X domain-containing protein [Myxococcaceae bacterium]|nr:choice-of-anchor X domain-containing protein [Myxococcaceae bacterium]
MVKHMFSSNRHLLPLLAVALCGCGLENLTNTGRSEYARPASTISGTTFFQNSETAAFTVTLGDKTYAPCTLASSPTATDCLLLTAQGTSYEVRLFSSNYSMIEVNAVVGNMTLRALVPSIGPESSVSNVNLDAEAITEAMIVEARLSADGNSFKNITPAAYLGTRNLIYAAYNEPGPTQDLLNMVKRLMTLYDPTISQPNPDLFNVPQYDSSYNVINRAVDPSLIARSQIDYTGDGKVDNDSVAFDNQLATVAKLYRPQGCPDPNNLRVVFTADFNNGALNGVCATVNKFKWATDKPGKSMFFVGWVHLQSPLQDPAVNNLLGASTPNQIQMYDDGTNGDEVAGDNIWTITFVIPRGDPANGKYFRIGYKFTWGTKGAVWTGSEEWPGNSRILEIVDVNGDGYVYRHETFGDEATNKDASNLNPKSGGTITWTTDLHGCGPEARENTYDFKTCSCDSTIETPKGIGPINVSCTQ